MGEGDVARTLHDGLGRVALEDRAIDEDAAAVGSDVARRRRAGMAEARGVRKRLAAAVGIARWLGQGWGLRGGISSDRHRSRRDSTSAALRSAPVSSSWRP